MDKSRNEGRRLWYRTPAPQWDHGMPIGNGRLGAMILGGIVQDVLPLNEETIWSGGPMDRNNPEGPAHVQEVRRLLLEGRLAEAGALAEETLISKPKRIKPYEPLGELVMEWDGFDGEATSAYVRELDLERAVASVSFRAGGVSYRREYFASAADGIIAVRLTASEPGALAFRVSLARERDAACAVAGASRLALRGRCDGGTGLAFCAELAVAAEGGSVAAADGAVVVRGADAATLLLSAASDFRGGADPQAAAHAVLERAAAQPYAQLFDAHVRDYRALYARCELRLGGRDAAPGAGASLPEAGDAQLPTDERLLRVQQGGEDAGLVELYFQFGRYLLISSSRRGTLPANLQGIWNDSMTPPWESDFHLNINLQMNYWLAETCNLAECHDPLFDFIETLVDPGRQTAEVHYGCRGFVAHHITDVWGFTTPGAAVRYGLWPMGAAWLCAHLWERYLFSRDEAFLRDKAYPIMREASLFFLDYLHETPDGLLLSGPSISPENEYILPNGEKAVLCMGPSMDTQLIRGLFGQCIEAGERLGLDAELRAAWTDALCHLPEQGIGKHGQLLEWFEDYEEAEPGHRHISHLYALHPGDAITLQHTPELAQAARRTLERRLAYGGGHTGWSCAWIVNFWARLADGQQAYANVLTLLRKSTLPSLLDLHPPFQIDGNFGGTAGIAEMLLQSHAGEIELLPALPPAWPDGEFTGVRARGGAELDLVWRGGRIERLVVRADVDNVHRIRIPQGQRAVRVLCDGADAELDTASACEALIVLPVAAGQRFELTFAS